MTQECPRVCQEVDVGFHFFPLSASKYLRPMMSFRTSGQNLSLSTS